MSRRVHATRFPARARQSGSITGANAQRRLTDRSLKYAEVVYAEGRFEETLIEPEGHVHCDPHLRRACNSDCLTLLTVADVACSRDLIRNVRRAVNFPNFIYRFPEKCQVSSLGEKIE